MSEKVTKFSFARIFKNIVESSILPDFNWHLSKETIHDMNNNSQSSCQCILCCIHQQTTSLQRFGILFMLVMMTSIVYRLLYGLLSGFLKMSLLRQSGLFDNFVCRSSKLWPHHCYPFTTNSRFLNIAYPVCYKIQV